MLISITIYLPDFLNILCDSRVIRCVVVIGRTLTHLIPASSIYFLSKVFCNILKLVGIETTHFLAF